MKKVIFEKEKCIGCGTCAAICPAFWEMSSDGKANLKGSTEEDKGFVREVEEAGCNNDAQGSCPVECIHINEN